MFGNYQQAQKKAIAYYRHSAEDKQENSVAIQREHTEQFARMHGIEIIHEEADEGKSGLLASRPAFERLFADWVENPSAPDFEYVLVYDVSRWGRFQDQDQAGYYTYLCKRHGKEVVYVSTGFPKTDNQLFSSLEISLHRYMAAEYSRQLSDKVFYGCVKVSEQGYSAGGLAVYGMARQLLDADKNPVGILNIGEHKRIANERVTFTPKGDETTEIVRGIFNLFVKERYLIPDIVTYLNRKGILSPNGKSWSRSKVIKILTDETYIGTRIYNKKWKRLKQKSHKNPRSEWIIVPNAFKAVIEEQIFKDAQERLYWMFPSNWRKGINAIRRARKSIKNNILNWLIAKGISDYEATELIFELPIIFAVKCESKNLAVWCFVISEQTRRFDKVLAVSVNQDNKNLIEDFFLFPVEAFTRTNYLIVSNQSARYYSAKVEHHTLENTIVSFIEQLKNSSRIYQHLWDFVEK